MHLIAGLVLRTSAQERFLLPVYGLQDGPVGRIGLK
jgi:hypothetical protein